MLISAGAQRGARNSCFRKMILASENFYHIFWPSARNNFTGLAKFDILWSG